MTSAETWVSAKTGSAGSPQKKKFGLVLQSGGALGAYEVGAIECLYDRGMECTIVAGASSGALNAVTLAAARTYPPDVLKAMWREFAVDPKLPVPPPIRPCWAVFGVPHMYRPRHDYWRFPTWTYVADNTPLKETLERLDWDHVRDPHHMRVFVSASDIENGKTVYFSNLYPTMKPPGPEYPAVHFGVEHVLASGSFPGGFPWTMIGDRRYWDGGLTDNTPLKPVIDHLRGDEPETMPIYVIDVNTGAEPKLPTNLLEVQLRASEMLLQNNLETDTHRAQSYKRFINLLNRIDEQLPPDAPVRKDADWDEVMGYYYVRNVHVVDMKKPAGVSSADFTREAIERGIHGGRERMEDFLGSQRSY
jgi:NTE family protein